jgi:hypothetical protein
MENKITKYDWMIFELSYIYGRKKFSLQTGIGEFYISQIRNKLKKYKLEINKKRNREWYKINNNENKLISELIEKGIIDKD